MTAMRTERLGWSQAECEAVVRQLWPYLDGALPERDRALVAGHMATCSDCEPHFTFARSFLRAIHLAHDPAPDCDGLRHRVVAALAAEGFQCAGAM